MNEIEVLKEKVRNFKILFVDDEKEILDSTNELLKKFFDDIVVCDNGEDALEIFSNSKDFDIVIADILMPKMDGVDMLKKIKEIDPNVFCVFISASRSMLKKGNDLVDVSLEKPITFNDLLMLIQKISEYKQ